MARTLRWLVLGFVIGASCRGGGATPRSPVARSVSPATVATSPAVARPIIDVTARPGLAVQVYAGRVDAGTLCWTFVTRGRASHGQPELVLSVVRRTLERERQPPADGFRILAEIAASPDVAAGTAHALAQPAFGERGRVEVIAVLADAPPAIPVPAGALTLMPATTAEAALVRQLGAARWTAMLAWRTGSVDVPWWFERDRPATLTDDDVTRTAWRDAVAVHAGDVTAAVVLDADPPPRAQLAGTWHLGVSRRDAGAFAAALAAVGDAPVLFALAQDPAATARLAWVPGQASAPVVARARTTGAPRVAANLLAVRVEEGRRGALLLEDGLVLFLSPAQRDAAVAALQRGVAPTSGTPTSAPLMPWQIDLR